jgi:predicted secreted protein
MPQAGYVGRLLISGNELTEATDVTLSQDNTEIETTSRGDDGFGAYIAGIRRATLDFTIVWKSALSVAAVAIETAFVAKSAVAVQVLDEDGEGWSFSAIVMSYTKNEPLDDAQTVDVSMRATGPLVKVGGTS